MTGFPVHLLKYILPPIIGAAIGYITNAIAIKMLFRPLVEKRILGLKVPFTPGIIPRQRGNLARNIANMVSAELLTEDAIRIQIRSENFGANVERGVGAFTERLLAASPGDVKTENIRVFVKGLEDVLASLLKQFVNAERFDEIVDTLVARFVNQILSIPLSRLFDNPESPGQILLKLLRRLLSNENSEKLLSGIAEFLEERVNRNESLDHILSDDVLDEIESLIQFLYQPVFDLLMNWLKLDQTRVELAVRGRFIVRDILDKLTFIQRFFISAAQYDRVLDEKMPEIIDSLLENLEEAGEDPKNRDNIIGVIINSMRNFRGVGLRDFGKSSGLELNDVIEKLKKTLLNILEKKEVQQRILDGVTSIIKRNGEKTLGDLTVSMLDYDSQKISSLISIRLKEWLRKPETSELVSKKAGAMVLHFFERAASRPLGSLLGLSEEKKKSLDLFISARVIDLIDRQLPRIVHTFDVESLVINKINGLDMENVEKLLLMVIAKHLRWINIFGAILGSIIGAIQIIVNTIT